MAWTFDKTSFLKVFPEFTGTTDDKFNFYVLMAKQQFDSDRYNIAVDKVSIFYNTLLAHLLALSLRGANGGVGTINSASQGSVSVGFVGISKSGSWYNQTPYGSMFWRMISPYLTPKLIRG